MAYSELDEVADELMAELGITSEDNPDLEQQLRHSLWLDGFDGEE